MQNMEYIRKNKSLCPSIPSLTTDKEDNLLPHILPLGECTIMKQQNLHISDVGKTYLLLKYSNLPDKLISDTKLKVNGDLSQFDQIRGLLNRLAQQGTAYRQSTPALMHYGEHETDDHDEYTHESYYQEDPEHSYQDDDGEWYVWDEGVSEEYDEDDTEDDEDPLKG